MKSILSKTIVASLLSLAALTSAQAAYRCSYYNPVTHQTWYWTHAIKNTAISRAGLSCARHSVGPGVKRACQLRGCVWVGGRVLPPVVGPVVPPGPHYCIVSNGRNTWKATASTKNQALAKSMGICTRPYNTAYAPNCHIVTCR